MELSNRTIAIVAACVAVVVIAVRSKSDVSPNTIASQTPPSSTTQLPVRTGTSHNYSQWLSPMPDQSLIPGTTQPKNNATIAGNQSETQAQATAAPDASAGQPTDTTDNTVSDGTDQSGDQNGGVQVTPNVSIDYSNNSNTPAITPNGISDQEMLNQVMFAMSPADQDAFTTMLLTMTQSERAEFLQGLLDRGGN